MSKDSKFNKIDGGEENYISGGIGNTIAGGRNNRIGGSPSQQIQKPHDTVENASIRDPDNHSSSNNYGLPKWGAWFLGSILGTVIAGVILHFILPLF